MLVITGSYPQQICGVGDYTYRLFETKKAKEWELYHSNNWSFKSFVMHIRNVNRTNKHVINMQYPTQGYGWSIVPHLLCIYFSIFTKKRFSVTIHEQSQLSFKARLAQKFILLTANRVIFTNHFERNYAIKSIPFISKRSTVIKIYSNISSAKMIRKIRDREYDLLNFGHIRPNKGIEKFIAEASAFSHEYRVIIAGQVPEGFHDFFCRIRELSKANNIELRVDLSNEEVTELLNNTKLIYLPFPDGVSERRGSLLAAFVNGAVVASTIGRFSTPELKNAIIDANLIPINTILSDIDLMNTMQSKGLGFMKHEMPNSWEMVAKQYNDFLR